MALSFLNPIGCIQERILFPRDMTPPPAAMPPMPGSVEWSRDRGLGQNGVAWFVPAPDAAPTNPLPCVVFFHGNAEIIDYQTDIIRRYRVLGCSTLLAEYPGYGRSDGFPTQHSILDDADYFYRRLIDESVVDPSRIVFHGRSLGGAVAAQLAERHEPAALILQSTFTSVPAMARQFLIPGFLVRHPFRTDRILPNLRSPLFITHGTRDTIIPVAHGRTLRDLAAKSHDVDYVEYDCGHNDFPGEGNERDYWRRIARFLESNGVTTDRDNEPDRRKP